MSNAKVTSKGQITIPKAVRTALGLEPGDRVAFRMREDGVVELHAETVDVMSLCGAIKSHVKGISVDDMNRAIRAAAGMP